MIIDIPGTIKISTIEVSSLPDGWRNFRNYQKCQPFGDSWYDEGKRLVLKVPSAVLPDSFNFVINTELPSYSLIKLVGNTELVPDERIEDILKKYSGK